MKNEQGRSKCKDKVKGTRGGGGLITMALYIIVRGWGST